jgi:2,3-bisphosphoglycerate-dependent phosphoglycerate mutase
LTHEISITLVRHGRSQADDESVHEGRYDSPLTETGRTQAEKRARDLLNQGYSYQLIIASPLRRAQETARILSAIVKVPVETDQDWIEMDNGPLAGLPFDTAATLYPRPVFRNPYERLAGSGESEWSLYIRAGRVVEKLVQRGEGHYLVVAHGGILNAALRTILGVVPWGNEQGISFTFGDLGYARLAYTPGQHHWVLQEFVNRLD